MADCLFCKIAQGQIPSETVQETASLYAFRDISPRAPTHILIIPKEHVERISDLQPSHLSVVGEMILLAKDIASREGLDDSGYRLVFNCGKNAGQEVFHIHLHLLGGRTFSWPPG